MSSKERPLMLTGPMVLMTLAGLKGQTRRMGTSYSTWSADDHVYMRESTRIRPMLNLLTGESTQAMAAAYSADDEPVLNEHGFDLVWWYAKKSCPAIHMPKSASRIRRPILEVRAEQLGDITEEDAIDEGITCRDGLWGVWLPNGRSACQPCVDPRWAYRCLFEVVNGVDSWKPDIPVWVIRYERRAQRAWREAA